MAAPKPADRDEVRALVRERSSSTEAAVFDAALARLPDDGLTHRGLRCVELLARLRLGGAALIAALELQRAGAEGKLAEGWASHDAATPATPSNDPSPTHDDPEAQAKVIADVERMVEGVHRLSSIRWRDLSKESAEALRRMFMAMAADVRVVLVALADRVETMRALRDKSPEEQLQVARETMDVYAPLANRLGVFQLKWELEDLAFRYLEPQAYRTLRDNIAASRDTRDAFVNDVVQTLQRELQPHGIEARIAGRPKHIYSIWRKMRAKKVPFEQIYDATAVRVLVPDVKDCYAVLGVVHGRWTPIAGEFDDYVARPKANGYQSLHTAVVGPGGRPIEIQIRTQEMHEFAEYGVAAHWAYKEGKKSGSASADRKFDLVRQLMDWQRQVTDPEQLAATLETDIFQDRVYVFTPAGDVVDLPVGSTPLDFAYRIHTMVGHRCRGARVNGTMTTLDATLHTGDRVEIITRKDVEPSRDWLNPHLGYLHTASAKQKVRQWFREKGRDAAIVEGREILQRELVRLGLDAELGEVAKHSAWESLDDMLAAIGFGDASAQGIASRAFEALAPPPAPAPLPTPAPESREPARRSVGGVRVDGVGDVLSQAARCCAPVPGDDVVGFVTRGRGIVIHRRDCPNVAATPEPERLVEVDWGRDEKRKHPVTFAVDAYDHKGLLRDIADVIAGLNVSVRSAELRGSDTRGVATCVFTVDVRGASDLVRLFDRIQRIPSVLETRRLSGR